MKSTMILRRRSAWRWPGSSAQNQPDYSLYLVGALLVAVGWVARGLFPSDYTVLAWLVPVVTFIVASRRTI